MFLKTRKISFFNKRKVTYLIFCLIFSGNLIGQLSPLYQVFESEADSLFYVHSEMMSDEDYIAKFSIDFLLTQMESKVQWRKEKALAYLGYKGDKSVISDIAPLVGDDSRRTSYRAIFALKKINDKESAIAIGESLILLESKSLEVYSRLLSSTRFLTFTESIPYLEVVANNMNILQGYRDYAKQSIDIITRFNESEEERNNLILEYLNSDDIKRTWAINKAQQSKDTYNWLPVFRQAKNQGVYLLHIRRELGETSFTEEEKKILKIE